MDDNLIIKLNNGNKTIVELSTEDVDVDIHLSVGKLVLDQKLSADMAWKLLEVDNMTAYIESPGLNSTIRFRSNRILDVQYEINTCFNYTGMVITLILEEDKD